MQSWPTPYNGEIRLCPPDNVVRTPSNVSSISFGVVAIYFDTHKTWRGLIQISDNALLGSNEANAICQQLGYSDAIVGSAVSKSSVITSYTFKRC